MRIETPLEDILATRKGFSIDSHSSTEVILIHGIGGTASGNKPLGDFIAGHNGFDVLGICLPGHATKPEDLFAITYGDWAKAIKDACLEARKTHTKVFIVGGSLGGLLALQAAEEGLVDAVVEFSAPLVYKHPIFNAAGFISHFKKYHVWKEYQYVTKEDAEKAKLVSYDRLPYKSVQEMNKLQKVVKQNLSSVHCPCLAIYGGKDVLVNQKGSMKMLAKTVTPQIQTEVFVNSGHTMLWGVDKEAVFAKISDFLANI
jgi:carboxylesterase